MEFLLEQLGETEWCIKYFSLLVIYRRNVIRKSSKKEIKIIAQHIQIHFIAI